MKLMISLIALFAMATGYAAEAPAPSFHEIPGLPGASMELRFTNPKCATYNYESPVEANDGTELKGKPASYCSMDDYKSTSDWKHSPQAKLIEWVNDSNTKEIFFAYLSVSNSSVVNAICKAIKRKHLKVTYVMDSSSEQTKSEIIQNLDCEVSDSKPGTPPQATRIIRGHTGDIGYAHNKVFIVNPNDPDTIKFAASSGNLSGGAVINHENWMFFTVPAQTYLAQAHVCLMKSQMNEDAQVDGFTYGQVNSACLNDIPAMYPRTENISMYFIPGDTDAAIYDAIVPSFENADAVIAGTHRMGLSSLVSGLISGAKSGDDIRLIMDDDVYWLEKGIEDLKAQGMDVDNMTADELDGELGAYKKGDNMAFEALNLKRIKRAKAQVRYMMTNHDAHMLFHNKIIVFQGETPSVWTGAGNLTNSAFNNNFENFYHISVPSIVKAYQDQMDYYWELAVPWNKMPVTDEAVSAN